MNSERNPLPKFIGVTFGFGFLVVVAAYVLHAANQVVTNSVVTGWIR